MHVHCIHIHMYSVHGTYICTSMIHEAFGDWGREKVHVRGPDVCRVWNGNKFHSLAISTTN